jgi:hypothetical protein
MSGGPGRILLRLARQQILISLLNGSEPVTRLGGVCSTHSSGSDDVSRLEGDSFGQRLNQASDGEDELVSSCNLPLFAIDKSLDG